MKLNPSESKVEGAQDLHASSLGTEVPAHTSVTLSSAPIRSDLLTWKQRVGQWRRDRWAAGAMISFVIFTDMLFYAALVPILPYIVEDTFGLSAEYSGVLMAAYAAGLLFFTPLFAYISDTFMNRKFPMVGSLLSLFFTSLLLLFCREYWQYLCLRILQGISAAGSWTVGLALATDAFHANQLGTIMGVVLGAMHFGYTAGPTLGGLLFGSYGIPSLCYFFMFMTTLALLFRLFVVDDFTAALKALPSPLTPKRPILKLLLSRPIWVNGIVILVLATVSAGLDAQLSTWLIAEYKVTVAEAGYTFLTISIPGLLMSPLVGYLCDKFSLSKILLIGMCGFIFITPWIAFPKSYTWTCVTLVIFGVFYPTALTPTLPDMGDYIQQTQPQSASQIYSVFNSAFSIGMLVGPLIQGFVYVSFGFLASLTAFAIVCFLALLVYLYYMKYPGWVSQSRPASRIMSHRSETELIGLPSENPSLTVSDV